MAAVLPDVVVLAAGRSSRMGQPKGLVTFRGKPWLVHQLEAALGAGVSPIFVLGYDAERYRAALADVLALPGVSVVTNPEPSRGPFSSLQCGLGAVGRAASFVLPIDVPAPEGSLWPALLAALGDADGVIPTHEGRGGHPVLLSAALVARLMGAPPTSRLDAELGASRVVRLPVSDPRVRLNWNAPARLGDPVKRPKMGRLLAAGVGRWRVCW